MAELLTTEDSERSREALKARFPQVWAACAGSYDESLLIVDPWQINVALGEEGTLYPYDASLWAREQVAGYWTNPDRLIFTDPTHCNPSDVSLKLLNELLGHIGSPVAEKLDRAPILDSGYMFVFGVGLGYHIPELVRRAAAHRLILIEPHPQFVALTTKTLDWEAILEEADEKKVHIDFIVGQSPDATVASLESFLQSYGNMFLDGSYFYVHYPSWGLRQAFELFSQRIKHHYLSTGFFEDEVDMMDNTFGNFCQHDFRVIGARDILRRPPLPAFVVGSGPSIDNDIEAIRRWQDRAVIVSCGTGLRVLMANGIRPDLHVEIENVEAIFRAIEEYDRAYDLSDVVLVGSSTLRPRVGTYFGEKWLFFRSGLSSTNLLGTFANPVSASAPLVSNAGFAISAALGFRDVYLFGTDCGRPLEGGEHHSKYSVYYQENFEDLDLLMAADFEENRILPGNFGGQFVSAWSYDLSRAYITRLQAEVKLNLYNCSNGALIEGAKPKASAAIDLSAIRQEKAQVMQRIRSQLAPFDRKQFLGTFTFEPHIEACRTFIEEFPGMLREWQPEGPSGFRAFDEQLTKWLGEKEPTWRAYLRMAQSSLRSMVRIGSFLHCRLPQEKDRRAFFDEFLRLYEKAGLDMAERAIELFEGYEKTRLERLAELESSSPAEEGPR